MPARARVVLITGASSGIGRACAERLHHAGFRVYGTSRHAAAGQASSPSPASSLSPSLPFFLIPLDVTSDDSVTAAVHHVLDREGAIDVVVNNAGYGIAGVVEETTMDEAREQFDTNVFGMMRMCRAVLPAMRMQGRGYIVNVSSIAGQVAVPFQAFYSASKFAVEGFTEALRMEVAPLGIRVVLVEPGDFRTGFTGRRRLSRSPVADAYGARQTRAIAVMERDETHGATPEPVARLVHRIVTTPRPRLRYTVGPVPERLSLLLKRVLPGRVFEWGIASYYRVR